MLITQLYNVNSYVVDIIVKLHLGTDPSFCIYLLDASVLKLSIQISSVP